ncbi:MAG: hypothetical protein AAF388_07930 [Bacteroidota bacterium]
MPKSLSLHKEIPPTSSSAMPISNLLRLQLFYCLMGILFNLISWGILFQGEIGLTPTDPLIGIGVMLTYALFLIPGRMGKLRLYRVLIGLSVLVFGYGGVINHIILLAQSPEMYYSVMSGVIAILINLFGLGLNLMAVFGRFK